MPTVRMSSVLLAAAIALPAAAEEPPCLTGAVVWERDDHSAPIWLTRETLDEVKSRLTKVNARYKLHWDDNTLIISCAVQGPAYDMAAFEVEGGQAAHDTQQRWSRQFFRNLAARSGHSRQEADALAARYADMGSWFPLVHDQAGRQVREAELILERHKRRLNIVEPQAPTVSGDTQQRAVDLKRRMAEAKKRGDMAEMMRLAGEAQGLSAPAAARAEAVTEQTDRDAWNLMVAAQPDLAQAAYRTRVERLPCPCVACRLPD